MAYDSFMYFKKPTNITGETLDADMLGEGAFEIDSFDFSVDNDLTITSGTKGAGAGKSTFGEVTITKRTDTASCGIWAACSGSKHNKEAVIELRRSGTTATGKKAKTFLKFSMKMVMIKGMQFSNDAEALPQETLTLVYGAMKMEYFRQDNAGKHTKAPGAKGEVQWSQKLNKPTFMVD